MALKRVEQPAHGLFWVAALEGFEAQRESLADKCRQGLNPAAQVVGAAFAIECFPRSPRGRIGAR